MRFASSHKCVVSLVNEFKLPNHGFYTSHPRNHVLLRGKHLRVSDLNNPALLPYRLTPAEQECLTKNGPDVLIQCALMKQLPGLAELHGQELFAYLQAAEVDGTPLYQQASGTCWPEQRVQKLAPWLRRRLGSMSLAPISMPSTC
jgi:hypothetical protein